MCRWSQCPRSAARGDWSSALALLQARGRLEERDLAALRWVLFAGEVFPTKHPRTLMEKLPHLRYANLYGPTETNVCAYHEVNLFRRNKRRRSRSAKLAQILTAGIPLSTTNVRPLLLGEVMFLGSSSHRSIPLPKCQMIRHNSRHDSAFVGLLPSTASGLDGIIP